LPTKESRKARGHAEGTNGGTAALAHASAPLNGFIDRFVAELADRQN
jgi:hypothetical protein